MLVLAPECFCRGWAELLPPRFLCFLRLPLSDRMSVPFASKARTLLPQTQGGSGGHTPHKNPGLFPLTVFALALLNALVDGVVDLAFQRTDDMRQDGAVYGRGVTAG